MIGIDGVEQTRPELATHDTDIKADIGDFSGRTYDPSLLEVLGVPDVDGKDLTTLLVTDRLDDATIGLAQIASDVVGIAGSAMVGTDNAALATTLEDAMQKATGPAYNQDTDSQEAISEAIATAQGNVTTILGHTGTGGVVLGSKIAAYKLLAGEVQLAETTEDLNQIAASYDLFTGTTQPVWLTGFSLKMPDDLCSNVTLTSVSVQTDDSTPVVLISAASGAVANLTAEYELTWEGKCRINVGTKIQLTIAGGAEGAEYITTATVEYRAIVDGGSLA